MKKIYLLFLTILFAGISLAQDVETLEQPTEKDYSFDIDKRKKFAVDLYGGFPFPTGDVKTNFPSYNAGIGMYYAFTTAFAFRADFNYALLKGENSRETLNEFFENRTFKWTIGMDANLFNILRFSQVTRRFSPFVGVGVGQIKSNIDNTAGLDGVVMPEHNYDKFDMLYVASTGFRVYLTKWLDMIFRYEMHFAKTDSLDGFDWNVNANKYYDSYITANLGLTFKIGKKGREHKFWVIDEFNAKNFDKDIKMIKRDMEELYEKNRGIEKEIEDIKANDCCDEMRELTERLQREIDELNQKIDAGEYIGRDENDVYRGVFEGAEPGSYHIIVGSFANEQNALREAKRIVDMGHAINIIYEPKVKLYRLSISSSMNFREIQPKVMQYRDTVHPKAWMLQAI
jgi:hypothetical protein